jgi:hypothetical protein
MTSIGLASVSGGCGGSPTDAQKYPPGQSPEDEEIRQQMVKGELEAKKAKPAK